MKPKEDERTSVKEEEKPHDTPGEELREDQLETVAGGLSLGPSLPTLPGAPIGALKRWRP